MVAMWQDRAALSVTRLLYGTQNLSVKHRKQEKTNGKRKKEKTKGKRQKGKDKREKTNW